MKEATNSLKREMFCWGYKNITICLCCWTTGTVGKAAGLAEVMNKQEKKGLKLL